MWDQWFRAALCSALLACLVGCKRSKKPKGLKGQPYVVATTGMLADAVKRVGGDRVKVEGLMGPSVDPHLYKATASDTHKLSRADLVIYNGLHLEGKMQGMLEKMGRSKPVVAATGEIPRGSLRKPPAFKGFHDPHVWFDVGLWRQVVARITKALSKLDPKHRATYEANARAYDGQLLALHRWTQASMALIPKQRRYLVTSHDAFGYFGRAYGLKVVGLQGVSTVAEAGVKDVERVIKLLVEKKIPSIFSETSVSEKMIKAVIQGCGSRKHKVAIGGKLFSDAMGASGTPEGTYVGMVVHNVKVVVKSLSGRAPSAFSPTAKASPRRAAVKKAAKRAAKRAAPAKKAGKKAPARKAPARSRP